MRKNIFVNLPVKNLAESVDFFTKLGFKFNPQFTDENSTCMIIEENIFVMLLVENLFKTFTQKEINDTSKQIEVIISLNLESKEKVNEFVDIALKNGGTKASEPVDHGFMYESSFSDINGHIWGIFWMNESHIEK